MRKLGLAAVVLLMIVLAAGLLFRRRMTLTHVDELLRARVPAGTAYQQVITLLDSLQVEHSAYHPEQREVLALWRRSYRSLFEEGSIQARFVFDEHGRLLRYEIKELVTAT